MENAILKKVITTYDIDTSHIIYDATNFFTYIDTRQETKVKEDYILESKINVVCIKL